jgi:hypothetical protein
VIAKRNFPVIMLVLLAVMMVVYHVGIMIYFVLGEEPLPTFQFLYTFGFLCGIVWFFKAESERSEVARAYCPGVTIGMAWVFLLPYHLIRSRGVRGLIPLFALAGTWFVLQVLEAIIQVMYTSRPMITY